MVSINDKHKGFNVPSPIVVRHSPPTSSVFIQTGFGNGNGNQSGSDLALGKDASFFSSPSPKTNKDTLPLSQPLKHVPATKAQVVAWPPNCSFRKNSMSTQPPQKIEAN
ncbi:hypothetical protein PIB30_020366 [Stylosanthes scabra]|uniref:Auxin-induced protein n=1 Tax=Stylosanthes scabra TaxID=79078 RepID=A0ABU6Q914_9FABA|nr:hypothetical protein [Stylosanthes scabra]